MRESPIPFSAPMVRAILEGTKTQTRRVVKPQPYLCLSADEWLNRALSGVDSYMRPVGSVVREELVTRCPYGVPGDRLWVKEAIRAWTYADDDEACVEYAADGHIHDDATWVWKRDSLPGMFMPRGLSRLTLEITDVRVERLQEISAQDCRAEGHPVDFARSSDAEVHDDAARDWYRDLWDSLNGDRAAWRSNPWVWVVSFRRVGA